MHKSAVACTTGYSAQSPVLNLSERGVAKRALNQLIL